MRRKQTCQAGDPSMRFCGVPRIRRVLGLAALCRLILDAEADPDPLYAAWIGVENLEFKAASDDDFAAHRNVAGERRNEAAEGVDLLGGLITTLAGHVP